MTTALPMTRPPLSPPPAAPPLQPELIATAGTIASIEFRMIEASGPWPKQTEPSSLRRISPRRLAQLTATRRAVRRAHLNLSHTLLFDSAPALPQTPLQLIVSNQPPSAALAAVTLSVRSAGPPRRSFTDEFRSEIHRRIVKSAPFSPSQRDP